MINCSLNLILFAPQVPTQNTIWRISMRLEPEQRFNQFHFGSFFLENLFMTLQKSYLHWFDCNSVLHFLKSNLNFNFPAVYCNPLRQNLAAKNHQKRKNREVTWNIIDVIGKWKVKEHVRRRKMKKSGSNILLNNNDTQSFKQCRLRDNDMNNCLGK